MRSNIGHMPDCDMEIVNFITRSSKLKEESTKPVLSNELH